MPFHIAYGVNVDSIEPVSQAIEAATQCEPEGHESSYLGVYDLFRIPEEVKVKYNFVEEENEWDYPEHKDFGVLIVAEQTERPDHIVKLVSGLPFETALVERMEWSTEPRGLTTEIDSPSPGELRTTKQTMGTTTQIVTIGLLVIAIVAIVAFGLAFLRVRRTGSTNPQKLPEWGLSTHADDGSEVPPVVAEAWQQVTTVKAVALDNATVTVHRAYNYSGPSDFEPVDGAKLIAVDVGVSGYTDRFKIWDVDIVDGDTNENYGSDPHVAFLNDSGEFFTYDGDEVDFSRAIRLLLVYGVPTSTTSVQLGYWGRDLTKGTVLLADQGPPLPHDQ